LFNVERIASKAEKAPLDEISHPQVDRPSPIGKNSFVSLNLVK
jgi:hypothetical protein